MIKIVTDSTVTLPKELIQQYDIHVVSLSVLIDGVLYQDSDLALDDFMAKMASSSKLPKTSQPPVGVFAELYDQLGADGSQVISIHLTQGLSGTVDAARQASNLTQTEVTVLDSDFIDQAMGFQVLEAAKMAKEGADLPTILAAIDAVRKNTNLYIGVATLENLVKGGRLNKTVGLVANLLNIKVIMEMVNGELEQLAKGRGNKTFTKWLDGFGAELVASGRKIKQIGISHAHNSSFAHHLKDQLQALVTNDIKVLDTGSIVATHAGPGAWAVLVEFE